MVNKESNDTITSASVVGYHSHSIPPNHFKTHLIVQMVPNAWVVVVVVADVVVVAVIVVVVAAIAVVGEDEDVEDGTEILRPDAPAKMHDGRAKTKLTPILCNRRYVSRPRSNAKAATVHLLCRLLASPVF